MATGAESQLTQPQIFRLAKAISADNMASIAERHMLLSRVAIRNIRGDEGNSEGFNRQMLRTWAYKNPDNQCQVR